MTTSHTTALTSETFSDTVKSNPTVLIDFWAEWCGPCRGFAPVYERVASKHPDVVFAKVDTEAQPDLAQAFKITSIPTLVAIREGIVLHSQAGALPEAALENLVSALKDVDMDAVRAELQEQP